MSSTISLIERHTDATQKLILATAVSLLESGGVSEVTMRGVAKAAGMSERTVFRYFTSREQFLEAIANEVSARLQTPPPPQSVKELLEFPRVLYPRFEEHAKLVGSALHTEI